MRRRGEDRERTGERLRNDPDTVSAEAKEGQERRVTQGGIPRIGDDLGRQRRRELPQEGFELDPRAIQARQQEGPHQRAALEGPENRWREARAAWARQ